MLEKMSPLEKKRTSYQPKLPDLFMDLQGVCFEGGKKLTLDKEVMKLFPKSVSLVSQKLKKGKGKKTSLKIGALFSGGQAPGGHNVLAGIFDTKAELFGFLNGSKGLLENQFKKIETIDSFRNQGGFHLLSSSRDKIESKEQLEKARKTCEENELDGLVIIGGDDSNTNAAILAEYFLKHDCRTKVIGVPKTIDADLSSKEIEISFGFDSATKTYMEIIGNIAKDALSSKKYYHFIKLMGRSASHITLECALKTKPNLAFISEERSSLKEVIQEIVDLIIERSKKGKNYGVILIPEGLIEFVSGLKESLKDEKLEKDDHGNLLLSKIQTEKVLIKLVKEELKKKGFEGPFHTQEHFLGYEGRSCLPSNFDANYCYSLGILSALAIREGLTGMIASIQGLKKRSASWQMKMVPIIQLIQMEERLGKLKPVIQKTLVNLKGASYQRYLKEKNSWKTEDLYENPGPIQFFGSEEFTDSVPVLLEERGAFPRRST